MTLPELLAIALAEARDVSNSISSEKLPDELDFFVVNPFTGIATADNGREHDLRGDFVMLNQQDTVAQKSKKDALWKSKAQQKDFDSVAPALSSFVPKPGETGTLKSNPRATEAFKAKCEAHLSKNLIGAHVPAVCYCSRLLATSQVYIFSTWFVINFAIVVRV